MSTFGIFEGLGHSAGFEVLGVVKGGYKVHFFFEVCGCYSWL